MVHPTSDIRIRKASVSDIFEMKRMTMECIQGSCVPDYNPEQISVWVNALDNSEKWRQKINAQYFIVAVSEDEIVGLASLDRGNYLDFLYVRQDFQRNGIAQKLFTEIQKESKLNGFNSITSDVSKTALPFFSKMNFNVVKENKHLLEGVELINYQMSVTFS